MVINMKTCPICEKGNLREGIIEEEMFGVPLGKFKAEICDKCNESFIDEDSMKQIEKKAKELGIWGLAEKIKIVKSGNSLAVRIPAKIVHFLKLREGEEVVLHPDGKRKMVRFNSLYKEHQNRIHESFMRSKQLWRKQEVGEPEYIHHDGSNLNTPQRGN